MHLPVAIERVQIRIIQRQLIVQIITEPKTNRTEGIAGQRLQDDRTVGHQAASGHLGNENVFDRRSPSSQDDDKAVSVRTSEIEVRDVQELFVRGQGIEDRIGLEETRRSANGVSFIELKNKQ